MDWIWKMPLAWGMARLELETGRIDEASARARELVDPASGCGERTWLTLGHTALAQVAMSERRWKTAERELGTALAMVVEYACRWPRGACTPRPPTSTPGVSGSIAPATPVARVTRLGRLSPPASRRCRERCRSGLAAVAAIG